MGTFIIIVLCILGGLSVIRILATIICRLINYSKDNYLGLNSLQTIECNFKGEFRLLPTINFYDLAPQKYFEISIGWLWFEYYKCYNLNYDEE